MLPDGRRLVAKHVTADLDWMMRATNDSGRAAELWVSGEMDRLPSVIDPALVRIEDGWWLYMDEVEFHRRGTRFSAAQVTRVLGALAALHATFWERPPAGLCALGDLLTLLAPERAAEADPRIRGARPRRLGALSRTRAGRDRERCTRACWRIRRHSSPNSRATG